MRRSLLPLLRCPRCRTALELVLDDGADPVETGTLRCSVCRATYPVEGGIPRFLPRSNYTASFGDQWNTFRTAQIDRSNGTRLSEERLLRETGRPPEWWRGRRVLDVGCGAGRFMDVAARLGAEVVGMDASDAVDAAAENLRGEPAVDLVQADVFAPPFATGAFDLVYCIGVVQHTPDPLAAVGALPALVRPGGAVAVTAYERRSTTPLYSKYIVRRLLRRLSTRTKLRLITGVMPVLFPLTDVLFRLPLLGRALRFLIPIANYVDIPQLDRSRRYEWALLDTLDMFGPVYDLPQREEDVTRTLRNAGVVEVRRLPNPGLNLVGRTQA